MSGQTVSIRFDVQGNEQLLSMLKASGSGIKGFSLEYTALQKELAKPIGGQGPLQNLAAGAEQATTKVASFKSQLSSIGSQLGQHATSLGVATASIWGVYNAYDSLEKVQIRAHSAGVRVQTLETTLASLIERRRIAAEKGNLTAEQMAVLNERITDTQQKLSVAQERSADITQDVQEAWAGFISTIGPQAIAAGGSITQLYTSLTKKGPEGISALTNLKTSFSALFGNIGDKLSGISPLFDKLTGKLSGLKSALGGLGTGGIALGAGIVAIGGFLVALGIDIVNTQKKIADLKEEFKKLEVGSTASFQNMLAQSNAFLDSMGGQVAQLEVGTGLTKIAPFGNIVEKTLDAKTFEKQANEFRVSLSKTLGGIMDGATFKLAGEISPATKTNIETWEKRVLDYLIDTSNTNFASPDAMRKTRDAMQPYLDNINAALTEVGDLVAGGKVDISGTMDKQAASVKSFAEVIVKDLGGSFAAASVPTQILDDNIKLLVGVMGERIPPELRDSVVQAAKDIIKESTDIGARYGKLSEETLKYSATYDNLSNSLSEYLDVSGASMGQLTNWDKLVKDNIKNLDDEKKAIDDTNTFWANLNGTMVEHIVSTNNAIAASIDYTRALTDQDAAAILVSQGFKDGIKQAEAYFNNLVKTASQEETFSKALQHGADILGIHADLMAFSTGKAQELVTATYQMNTGFEKQAIAAAYSVKWLNDKKIIDTQLTAGTLAGAQAANDWTLSMIKSVEATQTEHDQLVALSEEMGVKLPKGIQFTIDELHTLMTAFRDTGSEAFALDKIMNEKLRPSFEHFGDIFSATSWKEFKSSWKDLQKSGALQGIPKDLRNSLRDIGGDLININKHGKEATNVIDALLVSAYSNRQKGTKSGLRALLDDVKDIPGNEALGPFKDSLKELIALPKDERTAALKRFVNVFGAYKDAVKPDSPGGTFIVSGEAENLNALATAARNGSGPLDTFSGSVDGLTESMNSLSNVEPPAWVSDPQKNFLGLSAEQIGFKTDDNQQGIPTKATLNISEATGNIDRLIGNFNGWLNVAKTESVAKLQITDATKNIDRIIGNFGGWFNIADKSEPSMKADPVPAISAINRTYDDFQGWLNKINGSNPTIKASPNPAISAINRTYDDFQGWLNKINDSNPSIKANNIDAMGKINAVKNALNALKDKTVTVHVNVDQPKSVPKAKGGIEYRTSATNTLWGEAGPEIAAFFPLRQTGQPRKGDYDITIPSPTLDTSGIKNVLRDNRGSIPTGNGAGSGPTTVNLTVETYLFPGSQLFKKYIKSIMLEDASRYGTV